MALSILILLVGSCLNYIIPNPQRVFVYVYSASVLPGMVPWFVILIGQLRFVACIRRRLPTIRSVRWLFPWANYFDGLPDPACWSGWGWMMKPACRSSSALFFCRRHLIYKVFGLGRRGKSIIRLNNRQNDKA